MSKYLLILLIVGIGFYLFTESKKTKLKQKKRKKTTKVGETIVTRSKKNKAKIIVDAEDVEFEEIKENDK